MTVWCTVAFHAASSHLFTRRQYEFTCCYDTLTASRRVGRPLAVSSQERPAPKSCGHLRQTIHRPPTWDYPSEAASLAGTSIYVSYIGVGDTRRVRRDPGPALPGPGRAGRSARVPAARDVYMPCSLAGHSHAVAADLFSSPRCRRRPRVRAGAPKSIRCGAAGNKPLRIDSPRCLGVDAVR